MTQALVDNRAALWRVRLSRWYKNRALKADGVLVIWLSKHRYLVRLAKTESMPNPVPRVFEGVWRSVMPAILDYILTGNEGTSWVAEKGFKKPPPAPKPLPHIQPVKEKKYVGVSYYRDRHQWAAQISVDKRRLYLGMYDTPEEAARAYDKASRQYRGENAKVNFP